MASWVAEPYLEGMEHVTPHTVCAWCKAVITQGDEAQPISHGICVACKANFKKGGK